MTLPASEETVVPATDMPEQIHARKCGGNCVIGFSTPSLDYNIEYVRADLVQAAREQAVRECLRTLNEDSSRSWDECYDAIHALLHASSESSAWKTIETAPKDGTAFLAWQVVIADEYDEGDRIIKKDARSEEAVLAQCFWENIVQIPWSGGIPKNVSYTHWQPLPKPPLIERGSK